MEHHTFQFKYGKAMETTDTFFDSKEINLHFKIAYGKHSGGPTFANLF